MWKSKYVAGATGIEGGIIYADEEYKKSCRITLEKCEKCFVITCGVYGAMVHTTFADLDNYQSQYDEMKRELQKFMDSNTSEDEEVEFYNYFCNKY